MAYYIESFLKRTIGLRDLLFQDPNTLLGFSGSGKPSLISAGPGITISGNIISAVGVGSSVDLTSEVLGVLPIANGGTNLSALGSPLQVLRVNAGGTALEYASVSSTQTLAQVSAASTTTPNSLYTMSAGIPVEFRTSGASPLLYLDETNGRIGLGTNTPGVTFGNKYEIASGTLPAVTTSVGTLFTSTMPATGYTAAYGTWFRGTGAGNATALQSLIRADFAAGYTGSATNTVFTFYNSNTSTGTDMKLSTNDNSPTGNSGVLGFAGGTTTGYNYGGVFEASKGNGNFGIYAKASRPKDSAFNIAVYGLAYNTGATSFQIGGFFSLGNAAFTTSAALIADNGDKTDAIFLARDNGSTVFSIIDGGNVGINTTGPDRKLDILDATNPQLRLTHTDGSIYTDFWTSPSGHLVVTPNNGGLFISGVNFAIGATTNGIAFSTSGTAGRFISSTGSGALYSYYFDTAISLTATTGTSGLINATPTFAPVSGTGVFNTLNISPTINQQGGANGFTRGLFINPTLTSAADWRGIEVVRNGLGVTQTIGSGILLTNDTDAAAGAQQISPAINWRGRGWKTTATAASQTVDFRAHVLPIEGAANPTGSWILERSINGGAYTNVLTVDTDGTVNMPTTTAILKLGTSTGIQRVSGGSSWLQYLYFTAGNYNSGFYTGNANASVAVYGFTIGGVGELATSGNSGILSLERNLAATAGSTNWRPLNIAYTINNSGAQTGTATGIFLNATETALNSMTHNLMDLQIAGTSTFKVSNNTTTIPAVQVRGYGNGVSSESAFRVLNSVGDTMLNIRCDGASHVAGSWTIGAGNGLFWSGRSQILSPSDGIIRLANNAGSDFSRLQFGGTTSSFPSIKRNGTGLDIRLADDSGYAPVIVEVVDSRGYTIKGQRFQFNGGTTSNFGYMRASVDGIFSFVNAAETDFGRLCFGGTTSSFPSIQRSGAGITIKLADDSGNAALTSGSFTSTGFIRLDNANAVQFGSNRSKIYSPADSQLLFQNAAQTDFSLLQFGGTSASFPALKRSSASLVVRLADDTADADITAARVISTNVVRLMGYTVATLPAGTVGDTAYVTDATAPTYLGALTGGGAVTCPVFYDGSAWVSC